jgi:RNA polymerase sigma-70 factor (ECF subfamily)
VTVEPLEIHHHYISNAKADDHVELLYMVIQSLKDIDKAVVVLYLEGYRNKEIAEILKMSPTNVATRFNRVKSQLKMKFNSESYASK